jgi:hypothetical protein
MQALDQIKQHRAAPFRRQPGREVAVRPDGGYTGSCAGLPELIYRSHGDVSSLGYFHLAGRR